MKEILFEGIRNDNGEKVVGCLINNMFFDAQTENPIAYVIPNTINYDCWDDIAEQACDFEVIPETVKQLTFL